MTNSKRITVADFLFGVQTVCTFIFGGGQFLRALKTTQGVSISWFLCWEIFLLLNLVMTYRAHRNQSSRVTFQALISYCLWTVMVTLNLAVMIIRGSGVWNQRDTLVLIITIVGTLITLLVAIQKNLPLMDPLVKGWLAIFFKAVPQIVLGINILIMGGNGLAATTVWNGHITVVTRIGQLWFSIREAGWDRNRVGSAISEIGNEASWIVTTILWIIANHR